MQLVASLYCSPSTDEIITPSAFDESSLIDDPDDYGDGGDDYHDGDVDSVDDQHHLHLSQVDHRQVAIGHLSSPLSKIPTWRLLEGWKTVGFEMCCPRWLRCRCELVEPYCSCGTSGHIPQGPPALLALGENTCRKKSAAIDRFFMIGIKWKNQISCPPSPLHLPQGKGTDFQRNTPKKNRR